MDQRARRPTTRTYSPPVPPTAGIPAHRCSFFALVFFPTNAPLCSSDRRISRSGVSRVLFSRKVRAVSAASRARFATRTSASRFKASVLSSPGFVGAPPPRRVSVSSTSFNRLSSLFVKALPAASCVNHFSRSPWRSSSAMAPTASGHNLNSSCRQSAAATLRLRESAKPLNGRYTLRSDAFNIVDVTPTDSVPNTMASRSGTTDLFFLAPPSDSSSDSPPVASRSACSVNGTACCERSVAQIVRPSARNAATQASAVGNSRIVVNSCALRAKSLCCSRQSFPCPWLFFRFAPTPPPLPLLTPSFALVSLVSSPTSSFAMTSTPSLSFELTAGSTSHTCCTPRASAVRNTAL
mmetsp:Transcript_3065/g.11572  ORF Transcript_3065/g.11572 Transcript_3065/m.11572 type:complete len:352 (-) Transcript_3065:187-1242(-)